MPHERKKNLMQDVMPPKKSIRNVELDSRRQIDPEEILEAEGYAPKKKSTGRKGKIVGDIVRTGKKKEHASAPKISEPPHLSDEELIEEKENQSPYAYEYDEPKKSSKKSRYVIAGLVVIALAFGISTFFKSAKITITPEHQVHTLQNNFTAKKDATGGGLGFQIVTVTKDAEQTVPATGQKQVNTKATGQIVIFNNYSTASQKLVATTRFQTPEGLIYRLVSSVTVPGQQVKNGQTIAGSVTVTVVADASGDSYNIPLKDFVLPGLKGDPKYTKIYARSKTPMTGGFSGMQKTVSADVASTTEKSLENTLKDGLAKDIVSQIPANFVLYTNGLSYSFTPGSQVGSTDAGAVIKKTGTAYAVIFDKGALTRAIVLATLPERAGDMIKISNLENLTFSYASSSSFDPAGNDTTLGFTLTGDANMIWVLDENKLKTDLLGLSKTEAHEMLAKNNIITEFWLQTSPFWSTAIPKDPSKVTLVNTLAQ